MRALTEQPVIFCMPFLNVGNHMRNSPVFRLVHFQIMQPFFIESICIHQIACRAAKNLRISGPSKPFVSLRTIRWNIQEVSFHPPEKIVMQLIQQRIGCLQRSLGFHFRVQGIRGEIFRFRTARIRKNLCILKSHIGKPGMPGNRLLPAKGILHFCPRLS